VLRVAFLDIGLLAAMRLERNSLGELAGLASQLAALKGTFCSGGTLVNAMQELAELEGANMPVCPAGQLAALDVKRASAKPLSEAKSANRCQAEAIDSTISGKCSQEHIHRVHQIAQLQIEAGCWRERPGSSYDLVQESSAKVR